jgi:biotin-(acetyl-CoA carboxylase) ligase
VLVEMRAQPGRAHLAIIGIGINVSQTLSDFSSALRSTAISLSQAVAQSVSRPALAIAVLRELDRSYRELFAP